MTLACCIACVISQWHVIEDPALSFVDVYIHCRLVSFISVCLSPNWLWKDT